MANVISYNDVIEILQDIARRNYLINSFFLGKDWELENNEDIVYPCFQVYPEFARMPISQNGEYKTLEVTLNCKVFDLVRQSESNEQDVHSDMLRVAQYIINELNQHPFYIRSNASIIGDINLTALEEFEDDFTAGWGWQINLRLINQNIYCGIPVEEITGYSANGPVSTGYSVDVQYLTCATVTGCTSFQNYVATYSGSSGGGGSAVRSGTNTYTGGTFALTSVNISGGTLDNITVTGISSFNSASATTIYIPAGSSSTPSISFFGDTDTGIYSINSNNIAFAASGVTALFFNQNGQFNVDGSESFPSIAFQNSLNSGLYLVGSNEIDVSISGVKVASFKPAYFSAITINGNTILSASTNLYDIFQPLGANSVVSNGLNTYTAGTFYNQTVNISGGTVNNWNVTGGTLSSGGTDLYNIFLTTADGNDITRVQPGLNTYTGGTGNLPTVNISAATLNTLSVSGTANFTGALQSGGTNLYSIFSTLTTNPTSGRVPSNSAGTFVDSTIKYTGDTVFLLSSATFNVDNYNLRVFGAGGTQEYFNVTTGGSVSLGYTAGQPKFRVLEIGDTRSLMVLGNGFYIGQKTAGASDFGIFTGSRWIQDWNGSTNLSTIDANVIINSGLTASSIVSPSISATTISGGTILSGSTNLYNIFSTSNDITRVQPGSNITTGGTDNFPTINIVPTPSLAGISTSGNVNVNSGRITSGGTDLYTIFQPYGANSVVIDGLNTYTAGTFYNQSVNISAATLNNIIVSGTSQLDGTTCTTLSGGTVSGGTFYSAGTNLYTIINYYPQTYQRVNQASVYINASTVSGRRIGSSQENVAVIPGANGTFGATVFRIDPADFPSVNGLTPMFRIRVMAATNNAAITANYRYGIAPIVVSAATAVGGNISYSASTSFAGNTVDWLNPPAATITALTSSDFSIPATGDYCFMMSGSATNGATTVMMNRMYLEVHYV